MIDNILIIIGVMAIMFVIPKFWNKYSRRYNYRILRSSKCKKCSELIGSEALEKAIEKLKIEQEKFRSEAKFGTLKLYNMELTCPNCGTKNYERDLYKANRERKKIKKQQRNIKK
jgi:hypothetical protein